MTDLHTNPTQLTGLLAFAAAALACVWTAARLPGRQATAWWCLAAIQAAFALEILLGLRHRVHDLGENVFATHGWYAQRSVLQVPLVCIALVLALGAIGVLVRQRGIDHRARVAMSASLVMLGSLVLEAISLHGIDRLMYAAIGPLMLIAGVWVASAAVVALMAIMSSPGRCQRPPASRR